MAPLPILKFSHNWNNKLCCDYFTTIRLHNSSRMPGSQLDVFLKNNSLGKASIVTKLKFRLSTITDMMAYLDTGYSREEARKLLRKMYPDHDDPMMDFYLLKWEARAVSADHILTMIDVPEPSPLQLNLDFSKKRPGIIVETITGKRGRTFHDDNAIEGKIPVYIIDDSFNPTGEKLLCKPDSLKSVGFID